MGLLYPNYLGWLVCINAEFCRYSSYKLVIKIKQKFSPVNNLADTPSIALLSD